MCIYMCIYIHMYIYIDFQQGNHHWRILLAVLLSLQYDDCYSFSYRPVTCDTRRAARDSNIAQWQRLFATHCFRHDPLPTKCCFVLLTQEWGRSRPLVALGSSPEPSACTRSLAPLVSLSPSLSGSCEFARWGLVMRFSHGPVIRQGRALGRLGGKIFKTKEGKKSTLKKRKKDCQALFGWTPRALLLHLHLCSFMLYLPVTFFFFKFKSVY